MPTNFYDASYEDSPCNSIDCELNSSDIKCFNDHELLELLLSHNAKPSDLQKLKKSFGTLKELLFADSDRIEIVNGIDSATARLLQCIKEIVERVMREKLKGHPVLKSLRNVIEYCKATMSALSTEQLRVMFLNSENMLLFDSVESYGSVNEIAIYNRNIIKKALILEATGIILVHNHPSTSIKPSVRDISVTQKLACATEKVDIRLLDHIIIGGNKHFSMKKHGLIE